MRHLDVLGGLDSNSRCRRNAQPVHLAVFIRTSFHMSSPKQPSSENILGQKVSSSESYGPRISLTDISMTVAVGLLLLTNDGLTSTLQTSSGGFTSQSVRYLLHAQCLEISYEVYRGVGFSAGVIASVILFRRS
jgi:hypothetical protein